MSGFLLLVNKILSQDRYLATTNEYNLDRMVK